MRKQARYVQVLAVAVSVSVSGAAPRAQRNESDPPVQTREPAHVAIVGTDYAFVQLPATLAAGPTLFSFENRGTKRHEMSIALLRPGITSEAVVGGAERMSVASRAVADSLVGLLVARPGERSGGQLFANLLAGRMYVVICTLKDTPGSRPHAELGMVGTFQVH